MVWIYVCRNMYSNLWTPDHHIYLQACPMHWICSCTKTELDKDIVCQSCVRLWVAIQLTSTPLNTEWWQCTRSSYSISAPPQKCSGGCMGTSPLSYGTKSNGMFFQKSGVDVINRTGFRSMLKMKTLEWVHTGVMFRCPYTFGHILILS